jgi:hypothetical protein
MVMTSVAQLHLDAHGGLAGGDLDLLVAVTPRLDLDVIGPGPPAQG